MDPRDVSPGEDEEDKKIAHSNVHTLPVPTQLDIARGGEGEGSGSATVEKKTRKLRVRARDCRKEYRRIA